ncbi:alpha/beta fold hydrolase [Pseudomonas sp. LS44]|uniref:alpha/beta fold hydrolase n=1 Tax=Pseudomonas sp. LS44 TaxID=1357074 RepID=UPI00215A96C6|nr:alpha/beta fold hydrolase [Pseudomonas sp. LS44]UVE19184.1 alpha/beta fold hydrolase [Pseudomonas sp. LS44]
MSASRSSETPYWIELLDCQVRQIQGKYRTRIIEAGSGPALLLLHGTGGHAENYARNIAELAKRFHVIAMDFLWHGKSQTEGFDLEIIPSLVDQVVDVMDQLGLAKAFVEGQSLGGWVAMQLALQHPERVRALVLTTTMGYAPDEGAIPGYVEPDWAANLPSSLEVLRDPSFDNVRTRMARILAKPERLTDEAVMVRQALYRQPALAAVQQPFISEYLAGSTIRQHLVTDALARQIRQPTLVYWGDANRTPPALGQHIARQVQHGTFHCAQDTGHWAQFESAAEHNQVVAAFLESQLSAEHSNMPTSTLNPLGRWEILSWEQAFDDGRRELPMGEQLQGFIQYSESGHMACMIARAERAKFVTGGQWDAGDAEKAGAYNSMLAYGGRYEVNGDVITHLVDISLFPNWIGGSQKRRFEVNADATLTLSARLEEGTPQARTARLVWRRA